MLAKVPPPPRRSVLSAVLLLPHTSGEVSAERSNDYTGTLKPLREKNPAEVARWMSPPSHKTNRRPVPASKRQKATAQNAQRPAKTYLGRWSSSKVRQVVAVVIICLTIALACVFPIFGWYHSGQSAITEVSSPLPGLLEVGKGVLVGNDLHMRNEDGVPVFQLGDGFFTPVDVFSDRLFIRAPNPRTVRMWAAVAQARVFQRGKPIVPPFELYGPQSLREWFSLLFTKTLETPQWNAKAKLIFDNLADFSKSAVVEKTPHGRYALLFDHSSENLPHAFVLREV